MPIVDKQLFTNEFRERLSDKLTAKDIEVVLGELTYTMSYYDMLRRADDSGEKEFGDMMNLFLNTKRIEGKSENTLAGYEYLLTRFRKKDKTPIRQITVYNLRQWLAEEKARGVSDKTLQGNRYVFTSFFGWLYKEGLLSFNPCSNLMPIKCKKEIKKPYSEIDLELLREVFSTPRDKALVSFLMSTGCRVSEVCGLNKDDLDFVNLECTVCGKGDKERVVYFNEVTAMHLKDYFSTRTDDSEALFVGKGTTRLTPHGVRERLKRLSLKAGVANVHPHRFRRTLATNLISHGMPIQEVQAVLGHERIDTTMTYCYVDKQAVKSSYKRYL